MTGEPPRFSWVFFDLGDTLVDFRDYPAWIDLGVQLGVSLSEDHLAHAFQEVDRETDVPDPPEYAEWWRRVLERASGSPVPLGVATEFVRLQRALPWRPRLFSDTRRCLEQLREDGRRMGVISNSASEERVRDALEVTGIANYFAVVISSGTEGVAKPDPEIFRRAAERARVVPASAFYVGDLAYRDAKAAVAAGFGSVWLHRDGWGFGDDPPEITSLTELPFHLLQLEGRSPGAPVK